MYSGKSIVPKAISLQCMTKFTTNKKKIKKIKKNKSIANHLTCKGRMLPKQLLSQFRLF